MKNLLALIFASLLLTSFADAKEMRGAWIATVEHIDWPSSPNLTAEEQKNELIEMLDELKKLGINAIFLQVRPTADTFWPSKLEPWSAILTGKQGKNPGYDPLQFAIDETHKRDMELHAWFNPFRAAMKADAPLSKSHPAKKNKSWVIAYQNKLFYDPGNPSARAHSIKVITEVAEKYNVDGIHLDDYFYPYPYKKDGKEVAFNDDATFKKYAKEGQGRANWRRENINIFIRDLHAAVKQANPGLQFGISPFCIWCNAKDCEGGSNTAGFNSHLVLFADSRLWLRNGWLDYIAPQLYWHAAHKTAPFDKLLDWWSKEIKAAANNTKLYIGLAAYKHTEMDWKDAKELETQVKLLRKNKQVNGFIYFSAGKITAGKRNIKKIVADLNKIKK
jgi:uncharacterized lipoprotein YddW (UPF0748 family)